MNRVLLIAKYPLAVLVAALATGAAAAIITSVSNLLWLGSMPVPLDLGTVLTVLVKDIFRMGASLTLLLLVGYALAFSIAGVVRRWVPLRGE